MFSFLGLRGKDSKKSTTERETDGGFVIIGETVEEQRRKMQSMSVGQPTTNVIVQPMKPSRAAPARPAEGPAPFYPALPMATEQQHTPPGPSTSSTADPPAGPPSLPELLGDVPFTLAPHVLAMQAGFPCPADTLLSRDLNHNMAAFVYDFTLENSVLCDL